MSISSHNMQLQGSIGNGSQIIWIDDSSAKYSQQINEQMRHLQYPNIYGSINLPSLDKEKTVAKYSIFRFAAIFTQTAAEGGKAKVVVMPTDCLAVNETEARTIAARAIPAEYDGKLDQVEIVVRAF